MTKKDEKSAKKKVQVAVEKMALMDISQLTHFQGNLKDLSESNYEKLKKEIIDLEFSFAVHCWSSKGKTYIIDGHQRLRALLKMRQEGYEVPKIPVVLVKASDLKTAKKKILAGTSQFGEITDQGLYEFINESGLDWREVADGFRFAEIDMDRFTKGFFAEAEDVSFKAKAGSTELSEDDFQSFDHTCPKCGFGFDDKG